jgi:hypothetical protein
MTNRDGMFYVMPLGDIWLVRRIGTRADAYPTKEDAVAAAHRLAAGRGHVRVLAKGVDSAPEVHTRKAS